MGLFFKFFADNYMKMKEFGPPGGRASLAPTPPGSANDNSWRSIFEVGGPVWEILDPPLLGASILRNSGSVTSKSHSTFFSAETFCELSASQQDNSARTFAHLAAIVRITER